MPTNPPAPKPVSRSLLEVLQGSTEWLGQRGVESARLNAEYLAAHVLGKKKRIELYLEFDRPLGAKELDPLRALLRRRATGEPLQHLLGTWEFCGREFATDARALIPRPETEQLAELALAHCADAPDFNALDVGTGTGVLALTLAAERPGWSVAACDRSPDALALARENAARLGLAKRVAWHDSDLLAAVLGGPWDMVVANLPYIPSAEIAGLPREVQRDPLLALDGGPDGLDLVRRLARQARTRVKVGGKIFLEIGADQAAKAIVILEDEGWADIQAAPDHRHVPRFVFAVAPAPA